MKEEECTNIPSQHRVFEIPRMYFYLIKGIFNTN